MMATLNIHLHVVGIIFIINLFMIKKKKKAFDTTKKMFQGGGANYSIQNKRVKT